MGLGRLDGSCPPGGLARAAPRAVAILEAGIEDALAIFAYPPEVRLRLRTTNAPVIPTAFFVPLLPEPL